MRTALRKENHSHSLLDAVQARIAGHLYRAYRDTSSLLGNLDRWTQQRITDENLAKVALILDADDPAEACYRDLVREIDTEAETGIYLVRQDATAKHLKRVIDESGVSGELHRNMRMIAPVVFTDQAACADDDLDIVRITIQAGHDRAHLDATVSEIIMSFLMDNAESVRDMTGVMRALMYTFHEDTVRRRCGFPLLLSDAEIRDLKTMVTELTERSGNYDDRASEIRRKADTLHRSPLS
jgi:hypothetical protein